MGILQPLVVRPIDRERYQIVAGERRWRAARRAGLATVPCVIRELDEQGMLAAALVENLQREDLNPMEAAQGYRRLQENFGLTQEQVAQLVGKSRAAVANTLRLLTLPEEVQQMIRDGELSEGHGRALLALSDTPGVLVSMAKRAVEEGMSVRELEAAVRELTEPKKKIQTRTRVPTPLPPWVEAIREDLQGALATSVKIRRNKRGAGVIEIEFYSDEDLGRITEIICGPDLMP